MKYTRYLPLLLALTAQNDTGHLDQHEKPKEAIVDAHPEREITADTSKKVKKVISTESKDPQKIAQQKLEEEFWDVASDISEQLNKSGFNTIVNGHEVDGIQFGAIDFKIQEKKYRVALPNLENIDPNFKYNVVLFIDREMIQLKNNSLNDLSEEIQDYVQDSLIGPSPSEGL